MKPKHDTTTSAAPAPLTAPERVIDAVGRGVAGFFGAFAVVNVVGGIVWPGFGLNHWWIDVRAIPRGDVALAAAGAVLLAHAIAPAPSGWRRRAMVAVVVALAAVATWNAVTFFWLWARDVIRPGVPVPLSIVIAATMLLVLRGAATARAGHRPRHAWAVTMAAALLVAFPLAQMWWFGTTDYRRPADAVVVFGARAYADGRPSDALADRVRTGCRLWHAGLARRLVFSGGPGDGAVHETESMRDLAVSLGVPPAAITLDRAGLNTRATVANTCRAFAADGTDRVLVVSHFYHLPRVKLTYARAGREVYTVPAEERYTLTKLPLLVAREVVALWAYYAQPVAADEGRT